MYSFSYVLLRLKPRLAVPSSAPLAVNWYTNFAGNDGVNKDGDRAYSSYLELAAPFKLASLDWTATVGAVPFSTSF